MYKIIQRIGLPDQIYRKSDSAWIPKGSGNVDYEKFIQDVEEKGLDIVEGPTVGVTAAYTDARKAEYPPIEDQLDKIYHSGVNAWKVDIKAIKDKYPKTQVGVTTVAAVPSWVQTDVDERRKTNYLEAVERLKQPRTKLGEPYYEADQLKYRNIPDADDIAVTSDEANRNVAQAVIDRTPQSIIDSINT
tara:strand:+ start:84 stop:650 length:567 start_codon:yes stop_codon:yes gene_type:complete